MPESGMPVTREVVLIKGLKIEVSSDENKNQTMFRLHMTEDIHEHISLANHEFLSENKVDKDQGLL